MADWSSLTPVMLGEGRRDTGLYFSIRRLIESGAAAPGAKLPTSRDLAARLKLSRGAVIAAFEMLIAEGFAEARTGSGTFVAAAAPRLRPFASTPLPPEPEPVPPQPGALGVAFVDARTLKTFRILLSRHLARPGLCHFHYGDPRGERGLRQAIANYLQAARGVRCHADQVIVTGGAQHALDLILRAALSPGEAVWAEDPGYPATRATIEAAGGRIVGVPVDSEGLDAEAGQAREPQARAAVVTPSHQFPLGVTMSLRRRLALIDWARRAEAWIIEDDYDSEFRFAGSPLTALQGLDDAGRVAYVGTFSKVLFPGLRVGYAVLPEPLLQAVLALRAHADLQPPTLTAASLADLLDQGHFSAHLTRVRRRARASRDALVATLKAAPPGLLSLDAPSQGLHLVAHLPPGVDDRAAAARIDQGQAEARALSPMYVDQPPRPGLVIGFSGFGEADLQRAGAAVIQALQGG